jgi:hypothetical protein
LNSTRNHWRNGEQDIRANRCGNDIGLADGSYERGFVRR